MPPFRLRIVDCGSRIANHRQSSKILSRAWSIRDREGDRQLAATTAPQSVRSAQFAAQSKKKMPDVDLAIVIRHLSMCSSKD
jgi:hypothetical protein